MGYVNFRECITSDVFYEPAGGSKNRSAAPKNDPVVCLMNYDDQLFRFVSIRRMCPLNFWLPRNYIPPHTVFITPRFIESEIIGDLLTWSSARRNFSLRLLVQGLFALIQQLLGKMKFSSPNFATQDIRGGQINNSVKAIYIWPFVGLIFKSIITISLGGLLC